MTERQFLNSIPVDILSAAEIFHQLLQWMELSSKSRHVVTLNAVMLMTALKNKDLKKVITEADMVIADGYSIYAALKRQGVNIPERLTGIELVKKILDSPISRNKSIFFYGGSLTIVRQLKQALKLNWPQITNFSVRDGFNLHATQAELKQEIIRTQPDILLAGLGTPVQELFLAEILPYLNKTIGIGVGGSFEVIAGVKKETPPFLRRQGLEWLWRIGQEPKRIKNIPDLVGFWYRFLR